MTTSDIILENARALLRPLCKDDIEHLLPFSMKEPDLWTYSLQQGGGEANLRKYIATALADRETGRSYPFIVFDKQAQAYAGSTRFYDIQHHHQTCQLGFTWYGKVYQRTGLNRHCKYLLLEYAFEQADMQRIEFRADARNARSITAMKAIGCIEEGVLRSNCTSPFGRRDSIVLSILRDEWCDQVKVALSAKLT